MKVKHYASSLPVEPEQLDHVNDILKFVPEDDLSQNPDDTASREFLESISRDVFLFNQEVQFPNGVRAFVQVFPPEYDTSMAFAQATLCDAEGNELDYSNPNDHLDTVYQMEDMHGNTYAIDVYRKERDIDHNPAGEYVPWQNSAGSIPPSDILDALRTGDMTSFRAEGTKTFFLCTRAWETMREIYSRDPYCTDFDGMNREAAGLLFYRNGYESDARDVAEIAALFMENVPEDYDEQLVRVMDAEKEYQLFCESLNVTHEEILLARRYLFRDGCLSSDAVSDRSDMIHALRMTCGEMEPSMGREWFETQLDTSLEPFRTSMEYLQKALFLSNPSIPQPERLGDFFTFCSPIPDEDQREENEALGRAIRAFAGQEQTIRNILRQAEPAPEGEAYDPSLIRCALLYQDAAKDLAAKLPQGTEIRTGFSLQELPEGCRKPFQEGVKLLDTLRGRTPQEGGTTPAMKAMCEVYQKPERRFDYDRLNAIALRNLREAGAGENTLREAEAMASIICPAITDAKAHTSTPGRKANLSRNNGRM